MNPITGDVRRFDNDTDALYAGYTLLLEAGEAQTVGAMSLDERRAWLRQREAAQAQRIDAARKAEVGPLNRRQRRERARART